MAGAATGWEEHYGVGSCAEPRRLRPVGSANSLANTSPSSASRPVSRTPSSEHLWVDLSKEAPSQASALFVQNLLHHEVESQVLELSRRGSLATIQESVGLMRLKIGQGSLLSSVFTLVASAMGAGCLSLPHMFRRSGLGLGLLLLACGAALAHLSLVVLMSCARYTQCGSFAELVALSYADSNGGRKNLRMQLVVDCIIALYGVAAVLIYMMLVGDFFGGIAESPWFGQANVSRGPLILGSLVIIFPLSLPRHVSSLRFVCVLSTGSIAFMTLVVVARTPGFMLQRAAEEAGAIEGGVRWFAGDFTSTLQSFAIAIFAFAAHTNAVPMVVVLEDPRAGRIWRVSLLSVLIEFVIYALIAAGGYLSFLGATKQDFIRNYPADDWLMLVVRCVYSVPVVFGVPINLSPAAASLQALARQAAEALAVPSGALACGRRQVREKGGAQQERGRPQRDGDWMREQLSRGAVVAVVLGSCAALAIWSEAIADVIGLLGSFFGTLICLWWPQRIYQSVLSKLHPRRLSALLGAALRVAAALGVLAFLVQVLA